ncbi:BrnT family toxin [Zoogloea sp.]|uniref:BrnT family toxin n=1 Tax=Zoogloea sp. TaxID=49181 RepID=UPI00258481C5|nr:BrnT family toxin [Zoogloea sp.]MDD2667028.1 BrnT family toxin [Zoogloea sp.]
MRIEFDTEKRDKTLLERGLDFACAGEVFAGVTVTFEDARQNYGEVRFITVGTLDGRIWLFWSGHPAARRAASSA